LSSQGKKKDEKVEPKEIALPNSNEAINILKEKGADEELLKHCKAVSSLAVKIANKCKKPVDTDLVKIGGLLHDLGRINTHGIEHGVEGGKLAREIGLPKEIARIMERHIGGGLSKEDAERLGLPKKNYIPETLEEKIIAHADNLISGHKRAEVVEAISRLVRLREEEGAKRILALHKELSELCGIDLDLL